MLSNKKFLLVLLLTLLLFSCNKKEERNNSSSKIPDFNDPQIAASEVSKVIGSDVAFGYKGIYDKDTSIEIASGIEVNNSKEWGIKKYYEKAGVSALAVDFLFFTTLAGLPASFSENVPDPS